MATKPQIMLPKTNVEWEDPSQRGNCLCKATDPEIAELLKSKGLSGIYYRNNEPLFEPVAEATVEIGYMTDSRSNVGNPGKGRTFDFDTKFTQSKEENDRLLAKAMMDYTSLREDDRDTRPGNYAQGDIALAAKWSIEMKDGHLWSPNDVAKYRDEHKLTWHERPDCKTMDLVPTRLHDFFRHTGGTSTMK